MERKTKKSLYRKFFEHMSSQGHQLIQEDFNFIRKQLNDIPYKLHREALRGYLSQWDSGVAQTEKVHEKQNMGRRKANLYLLKFGRHETGENLPPINTGAKRPDR